MSDTNPILELAAAIREQTQAIQQLVEINAALIQAMADEMVDDESRPGATYLDEREADDLD